MQLHLPYSLATPVAPPLPSPLLKALFRSEQSFGPVSHNCPTDRPLVSVTPHRTMYAKGPYGELGKYFASLTQMPLSSLKHGEEQ